MTSTATPFPDALAKRLHRIQQLITAGELKEAAQKLNVEVERAPGDPRIYLMGMRLAEAAGNPAGALEAARRAVNVMPEWPVAVTELALLLARQNQFAEAIEQAQLAVKLDGNNPQVLAGVIDIAHRAQHFELAIAWLQSAMHISPGNADIQLLLARDWRMTGQMEKSVAAYNELLSRDPAQEQALLGRAQTAMAMGNQQLALRDCEALLAAHPEDEEVQFFVELARGNTPGRQPAKMVRALYDGFADLYDQHVVAGLKYKLPREIAAVISERYPDRKLNVLDLGCGTGLLGACLGRIEGALVGVDLSKPMIDQAIKHGVYDRFHNVDLLEALEATPESLYDVITALDVFVYVGDLTAAIPDAYRILRRGGHFIFSCEQAQETESDLVLRPTQRYAHKASHVEALCRAAGFEQVTLEVKPLRYEKNQPVAGFLVIARKPAA
ncbi:MAG: methyltransferase domain-containing protein [Ramlibacter sp.]